MTLVSNIIIVEMQLVFMVRVNHSVGFVPPVVTRLCTLPFPSASSDAHE